MYQKESSILLKGSVSLFPNNLSIIGNSDENYIKFSVISKYFVYLTAIDESGNVINSKQVTPRMSKDGAAEPNIPINIIESKLFKVVDRIILVLLSTKGIFFYEEDGVTLIYYHNLKNIKPSLNEETSYARGLAFLKPNLLAIGTCSGSILIFEIPNKKSNITLVNELCESELQGAILSLTSDVDGNFLCGCDTNGVIAIWNIKSVKNIKLLSIERHNKSACVCLNMWKEYIVCGFSTGLISILDVTSGKKVIDITAHARWINSIEVKRDKVISTSEDCFIRIWQFSEINGKLKVNNVFSEKIPDSNICGAVFNKGTDEIFISAYDNNEILVYKCNK